MFSKQDAIAFMRALGCEEIEERGDWLVSKCPLAPWFHKEDAGEALSFGVCLGDSVDDLPVYHCHVCGRKGLLSSLLHTIQFTAKKHYAEAGEIIEGIDWSREHKLKELTRGRRRIIVNLASRAKKKPVFVEYPPVPPLVLEQYPLLTSDCDYCGYGLRWLTRDCRVSMQAVIDFKLRSYVEATTEKVGVVFPILAADGETVMDMWVKLVDEDAFFRLTPSHAESDAKWSAPHLWFGNHLARAGRPVVLTEGPLDALRLYTLGPKNVLASFGGPTPLQIENLSPFNHGIHVAFGADQVGRGFAKETIQHLLKGRKKTIVYWVDWNEVGLTDARELVSFAQLKKAFEKRRAFVA